MILIDLFKRQINIDQTIQCYRNRYAVHSDVNSACVNDIRLYRVKCEVWKLLRSNHAVWVN
jgi:hypothetical protein